MIIGFIPIWRNKKWIKDAFENDDKLKTRNDWFNKIIIENKLFLLCIYEIETWKILADIETFNKIYNTKITYNKNPMFEKDPKEFLKRKNPKKYSRK